MSFEDLESGRFVSRRMAKTGGGGGGNGGGTTEEVAAGIFQITTAFASFQRLVNSLGTSKDTPALRDKLHKTRLNILQLIKDTKDKLKLASVADKSTEITASKRTADAKLAKDFKAIMQEFQKAQNLAIQREMTFAPVIHPSSYTGSEINTGSNKQPEQPALLMESKRQEVLQLENEVSFNEAIINEREQAIQDIQQQIGEVSEIFKDLAVLVHEQGETIEEINNNIENSAAATEEAKTHLSTASKTEKSNSSLVCLLLVIFGVVLLIVIIVLVT